jgi:hypothetical protein
MRTHSFLRCVPLLVLLAPVARALEPGARTEIRTLLISEHPSRTANNIYVSGRVRGSCFGAVLIAARVALMPGRVAHNLAADVAPCQGPYRDVTPCSSPADGGRRSGGSPPHLAHGARGGP